MWLFFSKLMTFYCYSNFWEQGWTRSLFSSFNSSNRKPKTENRKPKTVNRQTNAFAFAALMHPVREEVKTKLKKNWNLFSFLFWRNCEKMSKRRTRSRTRRKRTRTKIKTSRTRRYRRTKRRQTRRYRRAKRRQTRRTRTRRTRTRKKRT